MAKRGDLSRASSTTRDISQLEPDHPVRKLLARFRRISDDRNTALGPGGCDGRANNNGSLLGVGIGSSPNPSICVGGERKINSEGAINQLSPHTAAVSAVGGNVQRSASVGTKAPAQDSSSCNNQHAPLQATRSAEPMLNRQPPTAPETRRGSILRAQFQQQIQTRRDADTPPVEQSPPDSERDTERDTEREQDAESERQRGRDMSRANQPLASAHLYKKRMESMRRGAAWSSSGGEGSSGESSYAFNCEIVQSLRMMSAQLFELRDEWRREVGDLEARLERNDEQMHLLEELLSLILSSATAPPLYILSDSVRFIHLRVIVFLFTDPEPANNASDRRGNLMSEASSNLTLAVSEAPTLLSDRHDYEEVRCAVLSFFLSLSHV